MDRLILTLCLLFFLVSSTHAYSFLLARNHAATIAASAALSGSATASLSAPSWSPTQLVDVTAAHAYQDPLPDQARGPCPAQNALANHGYLDRSGFTTFPDCVTYNTLVWNLGVDVASFLCFQGMFTGGDTLGVTPFSIGNSSAVQSTINNACPNNSLLGSLLCSISPATLFLDDTLGTAGFGLAQTHNSFEGDSSFVQPDWGTTNGIDASTISMTFFNELYARRTSNDTFDNFQIIADWASYRKNYSIATNPCYLRTPVATIAAALGAYTFIPALYANYTPEYPDGTLSGENLATFFGVGLDSHGNLAYKGFGKEQIPGDWYHRPTPFTATDFFEKMSIIIENDHTLADIGGNTNGVNTFTGLDIGNVTGGVINGENLLEGGNFACLYYRALQIDLENKLPSAVGAGLIALGPTLGAVVDAIGDLFVQGAGGDGVHACPQFTYTGMAGYTDYCGVRQQPGGTM